ncbi:hypothetical protein SUDANB130_02395 [Streptomyces sp. enrichment culture]
MAAASHRGKGSTRSSDIRPTRLSRTAPGAYRAHTARAGGARRGETDDDTGRDAHRPPRTPPKTPPPPRPPGRGRPDPDGGRGDTHPPVDTGRPAEGHAGGRAPLPGGERRPDGTERECGGGGSLQDPHPPADPTPGPAPDVTESAGREGAGAAHPAADTATDAVGEHPHDDAPARTPDVTHIRTSTGTPADTTATADHDTPASAPAARRRGQGRGRRPRALPPPAEHLPGRLRATPTVSRRGPPPGESSG